ncbi:MAG: hypothetical protein BWX84_00413 [Verrucomicrobia bacterium ADurb.Bin118]|jgi:hypothetical protein|nr:MAG: hypothetical protein BWX84_00413 [Verrucomicrobia bacterium ADurb.Bin118]
MIREWHETTDGTQATLESAALFSAARASGPSDPEPLKTVPG